MGDTMKRKLTKLLCVDLDFVKWNIIFDEAFVIKKHVSLTFPIVFLIPYIYIYIYGGLCVYVFVFTKPICHMQDATQG